MAERRTTLTAREDDFLAAAFAKARTAGYDSMGLVRRDSVAEFLESAVGLAERYFLELNHRDLIRWGVVLRSVCHNLKTLNDTQLDAFYGTYIDYWAVVHETPGPKDESYYRRLESLTRSLELVKNSVRMDSIGEFPELLTENLPQLSVSERKKRFQEYLGPAVVDLFGLEAVTNRWVKAKERRFVAERLAHE